MMNWKLNQKFYLVTSVFLLAGCGSNTDTVKNSTFKYVDLDNRIQAYDESYTIAEAFENRKVCKEIKWSEFEDDRGREIVQYECVLDEFAAYFPGWLNSRKQLEIGFYTNIEKKVSEYQQSLAEKNEALKAYQPIVDNRKNDYDAYHEIAYNYNWTKDKVRQLESSIRYEKSKYPNGLEAKIDEIEMKYARPYIPESASEIYQWVITKEDEPVYVYNGMDVHYTSGQTLTCGYDLFQSLDRMHNNVEIGAYGSVIQAARYWTYLVNAFRNFESKENLQDIYVSYITMLNSYDVKAMGSFADRLECEMSSMK